MVMIEITIEFMGNLVELVSARTAPMVTRRLPESTSIKDAVEALGIPHCELAAIRANNRTVDWSYRVQTGDRIVVYPAEPQPLRESGFICDQHLGKLARMLRTLGFDTAYGNTWREPEIARRATWGNRAVLTCSRALLKRRAVVRGQLIRSARVDQQVVEVLTRFQLVDRIALFGRCSLCNGLLRSIAKQEIADRIPPRTALWLDIYYICRNCSQLYWEGTHVLELRKRIDAILKKVTR